MGSGLPKREGARDRAKHQYAGVLIAKLIAKHSRFGFRDPLYSQ